METLTPTTRTTDSYIVPEPTHQRSLLCWRSIFAGTILSIFFYLLLLAAGIGMGGVSMSDGVASAENVGIGTGIWMIISVGLALFGGVYIASRSTRFVSRAIGMWQAAVIAALFFVVVTIQVSSAVGNAGSLLGRLAGSAAVGAANLADNPAVQDVIGQATGGLNLRSEPDIVARGIAVRLLQGDGTAARNYLAREAGITPAEAQLRIDTARQQVEAYLVQAREAAGKSIAAAGWSLFTLMLIGLLAAIGGGVLGARENLIHPVSEEKVYARSHRTAGVTV